MTTSRSYCRPSQEFRLIRDLARFCRNRLYGVRDFIIPAHISSNFRSLRVDDRPALVDRLKASHFSNPQYYIELPDAYLATPYGKEDLENHVEGRLTRCRKTTIPWIDSFLPLRGARILEIGCGTGTSTVALAEQGAVVTAFDVDQMSLECARARLSCYSLEARLIQSNATSMWAYLNPLDFDAIVCIALLEHMTLDERIAFLTAAWQFLRPGGLLIIDDTPNRLWFHDPHTSYENFFFWLPDDLAMKWAPRTKRPVFNTVFSTSDDTTLFSRWGRGVSYHDFCLSFDVEPPELPVASSKQAYLRAVTNTTRINASPFERFLRKLEPSINGGFMTADIEVAFKKG